MRRFLILALTSAALVSVALITRAPSPAAADKPPAQAVVSVFPEGVMDTDVELTAIVAENDEPRGDRAVEKAEEVLRAVDARMSAYQADSDISAINKADVGQEAAVSKELLEVLKVSRDYTKSTDGVFDVTVRPLLQLWKRAGKAKRLPTKDELTEARALVGWGNFKVSDRGVTRLKDGTSIDLGGIAKKWAIDRAAEEMQKHGLQGGLVNVGGDIRIFGERKGHGKWRVGIKDPFEKGELIASISIKDGAVCTSGNYERFVVIDGKKYSHIVDPRTGWTADAVPSVTVVGKTAVEAGVWATALSVLGPDGFKLMPKDLDAMIITGTPERHKFHYTPGFKKMLDVLPEEPLPPLTTKPN